MVISITPASYGVSVLKSLEKNQRMSAMLTGGAALSIRKCIAAVISSIPTVSLSPSRATTVGGTERERERERKHQLHHNMVTTTTLTLNKY